MKKVFVLIGASSELSESFQIILNNNKKDYITISRSSNSDIFIENYIKDVKKIIKEITNYDNLYIIFFNGYLAENRPIEIPNDDDLIMTDYINFTIPYSLTKKFIESDLNISKFVYISSMAAIKPRNKNYIYGLSKSKLEKSLPKIIENYLIFRFGKIDTKMSESHGNVPFSLSQNEAANIIFNKIESNKIVYPSLKLKVISLIIFLMPMRVIDFIEKRLIRGV